MLASYNVAIIGCGMAAGGYDELSGFEHAFTHAGAIKKHKLFNLVAISDNDEKRLNEFKKTWNVNIVYVDYIDLLKNEKLDLLCIAVPDDLHYSVLSDTLRISDVKHVLVEKPIALKTGEAYDIIQNCQRKSVSLYVNYNRRWDQVHGYVRNLIKNEFLGKIQFIHGYYVRGLLHNGTTMFNTLRMLLSDEVKLVQSLQSFYFENQHDYAMDAILEFENGSQACIIAADKSGYGHSIFEIDIMGNNGRIRLIDNGYQVQLYERGAYKRYSGVYELKPVRSNEGNPLPLTQMPFSLINTLDEIAIDIKSKKNSLKHAEDAITDLFIAEALLESNRQNCRKVSLHRNEKNYY